MNPRTLSVKRRPISNGFFKRIHAVTRNRNQRVSTAAGADEVANENHSARISRGFTIILAIHVVAVALYFVHLNFLNDHSVAKATPPAAETAAAPKPRTDSPPMFGPSDATCIVVAGDTYARIAAREGVDEAALRAANQNKTITAGLTFHLPPKRIAASESAMVVNLRNQLPLNADHGLEETTPVEASEPSRPLPTHPKVLRESTTPKAAKEVATTKSIKDSTTAKATKDSTAAKSTKDSATAKATKDSATAKSTKDSAAAKSTKDSTATKSTKDSATAKTAKEIATAKTAKESATASKQSYTVKSGDNLYRIAKRYKIDQTVLMRANNITDPAKLNSGTTLVIPH
ncbi:MAG: LysM peptidoglycan-binding domain-containing protein [Verrucomicrobiota bacterium]